MKRRTLILAPLALATPAHAALKPDTKVRLLGGDFRDGVWQAGIEIEIGKGWKTYWRMPGDAGIPPEFDWSASRNANSIDVLFPAPTRFNDAAGESIGYKSRVLYPVRVMPEDAAKPVMLDLKLFFAVCDEICIPSRAESAVLLDLPDLASASLIAAAEARVPATGTLITGLRAVDWHGKAALEVTLSESAGEDLDIFVEGAEPAYVRAPRFESGVYILAASGVKDHTALRGKALRITLAGTNILLEQTVIVA
jgi:DsbC/DsbD-like thiol-disulfide interchange protein